jgi:hypothetical protein
MVTRTLEFENETVADKVMHLVEIWHDKQAEITRRYEKLDAMYTSPEAIATRAAIAQMCATHNV